MIARVITADVAVARGVGGRRGKARLRAKLRALRQHVGRPAELPSLAASEARALRLAAFGRRWRGLSPEPLGYRERRRRAKLRRRARDRDVARNWVEHRHRGRCPLIRAMILDLWRFHGRPNPWWSTPEGRRGWMQKDCAAKQARRERVGR